MTDTRPHISAAAAHETYRKERAKRSMFMAICRTCGKIAFWIPAFVWILGGYVLMALYAGDTRTPFVQVNTFAISWIEVLYVLAFAGAMNEITKVIRPGDDNTKEALAMTFVAVCYVVLFTISLVILGFGISSPLAIFATSEFAILILFSWVQVVLAFKINSATLKRTFSSADE